ncbi:MAG: hypothetical protein IKE05_04000 [Clostridia bacterium]|nr:hypothetical protein [Clostridia bacterium]
MKEENKKQLSGEDLEDVAGGGVKEQLTAGILGISALVSPVNAAGTQTDSNSGALPFAQNTVASQRQENISLIKYLKDPCISEAQEKAFSITDNLEKQYHDHLKVSQIVSSSRYYSDINKTPLEGGLDEDVQNGDLPLPDFTIEDMKNAKNSTVAKGEKNVRFVLYPILDALKLHQAPECQDGDIVNLASQFNALESVSNTPTAVKYWYLDKTQGPYCALQSVAATKHREAAHLQGKLTDALEEALQYCKVDGQPITEKYPNLYQGGYLEMMEITDGKDMATFLAFLENENNLSKHMKVLMQWVKCEGTDKKQLQFFTAAPSFQSYNKNIWASNSKLMDMRRKACVKLVELQYRAMAQAAAIMASETGKNVRLHVTMVGHGVFNNPEETIQVALKALNEELQGVDATVFLHSRPFQPNIWKTVNTNHLGIKLETMEDWKNSKTQ